MAEMMKEMNEMVADAAETEGKVVNETTVAIEESTAGNDEASTETDATEDVPEKEPETVAEKMEMEKANCVAKAPEEKKEMTKQMADMVLDEFVEYASKDDALCEAIMQKHKTFERCFEFMYKKAIEMAGEGAKGYGVTSVVMFEWMREYYMLDDKAQIEEEEAKKALEEATRKAEAEARKNAPKSALDISIEKSRQKAKELEEKKQAEAAAKKLAEKEAKQNVSGQMDFMSLFGM